jgi:pimeloyl-ACP methyl ester carboxylesterase
MILLHGGLGSGEMFGPILPTLADHHQVIAVDLQGHGRTPDIERPLDIRLMADASQSRSSTSGRRSSRKHPHWEAPCSTPGQRQVASPRS